MEIHYRQYFLGPRKYFLVLVTFLGVGIACAGGDRAGWQSIGYTGPPQTGPGDRFGFAPHEVSGPQPKKPPLPSRL